MRARPARDPAVPDHQNGRFRARPRVRARAPKHGKDASEEATFAYYEDGRLPHRVELRERLLIILNNGSCTTTGSRSRSP